MTQNIMTRFKIIKPVIALGVVMGVIACTPMATKLDTATEDNQKKVNAAAGTLLIYMEQNSGVENFTTRLFVNKEYLHISDSNAPADFIVFNRAEQTVYSVTNDEQTILVIRKKEIAIESPIELDYQEESQVSGAIPKVDGKQATHYKYFAKGEHCYDAVVLPNSFVPDALEAIREYRMVLAGEHATTIGRTPKDLLDACDLSVNVFHATKHMDHGLPVREWGRNGYQRFLKGYRLEIEPPEGLFDLPKDFKQYSIDDIQTGGMNK